MSVLGFPSLVFRISDPTFGLVGVFLFILSRAIRMSGLAFQTRHLGLVGVFKSQKRTEIQCQFWQNQN